MIRMGLRNLWVLVPFAGMIVNFPVNQKGHCLILHSLQALRSRCVSLRDSIRCCI
jgi:hypothetical protein